MGSNIHLTETGETSPDVPHLIVQVQTTVATVQDVEVTAPLQQNLAQADLLPEEQFVETGSVDAELLVSSQQDDGITLVGPVLSDTRWQAKAGSGFDAAHVPMDWPAHCAPCPQGQQSARWTPLKDPERIEIVCARMTWERCPCRTECSRSQTTGRVLHVRPQAAQEALLARRQEQETPTFRQPDATRAGSGGTLSQGGRGMSLRRGRSDGLQKTHVQHVRTAVVMNLVRIDAILTGIPRGQTRPSSFASRATHPTVQRKLA